MRGLPSMTPRLLLPLALALVAVEVASPRVCRAGPTPQPAAPAGPQPVDEQTEFEKARNAYRAQKYDEADARFLKLLDPKTGLLHDRVLITQARMYWAATRIAQHHEDDATDLFEAILTDDRDYEPDPLAFPTDVGNAFIDTRARLREKLEAIQRERYQRAAERRKKEEEAKQAEVARVKMLELYATRTEVTERRRRLIALIPFGAGQFQNRQRGLGWAFLGTEAALLAGTVTTVAIYLVELHNSSAAYSASPFYSSANASLAQQYLDRARDAQYVNLAFNGALAATAVAGVIQAEAAFVPEVTEFRERPIPGIAVPPPAPPPPPSISFGVLPLPGRDGQGVVGGVLTLHATF